jgi:DNA-binding transcriptional MerR regulator
MSPRSRHAQRAPDPIALSIGQVAALADVTRRAVRHYERCGVLPAPQRTEKGYRRYTMATVVHLIRIRRLRTLGLSVPQIRAALTDSAPPGTLHDALRLLDGDLARRIETLEQIRHATQTLLAESGSSLEEASGWRELLRTARQTTAEMGKASEDESRSGATLADLAEFSEAVGGPSVAQEMQQRLQDPTYALRLQELSRRLHALARLPADQTPAESESLAAAFARDLPLNLLPSPLADPAMLTILLGERLSLVQVRCLERAWALAHAPGEATR